MGVTYTPPASEQDVVATGTFSARPLAAKLGDTLSVKDFGAFGDGSSHPLSGVYGTLAAAQVDYPAATSLSDEFDYVALAKAVAARTAGKIILPAGTYLLSGNITVGDGISFYGDGSANLSAADATVLKCTTAAAGLSVAGSGQCAHFTVDGNAVGTLPLQYTGGSSRTWIEVVVRNSAQDNWLISVGQNNAFVGCQSVNATRDNLVLDNEAGGHVFVRFESSGAGRYALCSQQTRTPQTGYTMPTHLTFLHSIFERAGGNYPRLYGKAFLARFINCVVAQPDNGTAPAWNPTAGLWTLDGTYTTVVNASANHIQIGNGATLNIVGRPHFNGGTAALDAVTGSVIHLTSDVNLGGGVSLLSAATPSNGEGILQVAYQSPVWVKRIGATDTAYQVSLLSDAGGRLRIFGDGTIGWGGGTTFNFSSRLSRLSSGDLSANVGIQAATVGMGGNKMIWGTLPPVSGTWTAGDVCWNTNVNSFQPEGWRCTNSGTPGTWTAMANHP